MATLYRVGEEKGVEVKPANGREFTLEEVQALVGGYVEMVALPRKGESLLCDEEGMLKNKRLNLNFHCNHTPWALLGDVLVVKQGEF